MFFDLNTTNNLPQSSTSSCTDYFFDGCYNKTENNQYQTCHCRPCCVNSMINDHTYSLLKKICRKVIRDYHRQKSREKYTIFDGGNSINVRIHRSSFGKGAICQLLDNSSLSTIGKTGRKDVTHVTNVKEGKYGDRRKHESISDKNGKGDKAKKHGEKEKLRKSQNDFSDSKQDWKKNAREQEYDDERENMRKGRRRKGNDIDEHNVNENGKKGKRGKGVENNNEDKGNGKREKGRKFKSTKQGENEVDEASGKKKGKGETTIDTDKKRISNREKEMHGRKQKSLGGDEDEKDGDVLGVKIGKKIFEKNKRVRGSEDENPRHVKGMLDKSRNKTFNEESGTAKGGKIKQRSDLENKVIDIARIENYDGKKRLRDDISTEVRYNEYNHKKKSHFGITKGGHDGYKDGKNPESKYKASRDTRIINGDHNLRDYVYRSAEEFADSDRKKLSQKKKDISGFPIILDLRTKVRKGHDVTPVRKSATNKDIYHSRSTQDGRIRKKGGKHGQEQYSKGSKDEINDRLGIRRKTFRSSHGLRGRFAKYRIHGTGMSSRCDEIRPCDILRAYMEQRELCERQRCCCLFRSCDCSAVYCQDPSTICSRIC